MSCNSLLAEGNAYLVNLLFMAVLILLAFYPSFVTFSYKNKHPPDSVQPTIYWCIECGTPNRGIPYSENGEKYCANDGCGAIPG